MARTPDGSNALILEVLNRHNYKNWRSRMKTYLLAEDLWEVVQAIKELPAEKKNAKAWTKKNAKALYAIQNSCGQDMFPLIRETETAKSAWEALEKVSKFTGHVENSAENFKPYIPFTEFVIEGDWDKAKECLREVDVRSAVTAIDPRDECGDTALHVAARQGHVHIVKALVELMTLEDLKMKNAEGSTALHTAALNEQVHTVKELVLLMGEEKDSDGDTALHIAVHKENADIMKELVMFMRQEDMKIKNNDGYTALHLAVNKGNVSIVKELGPLMGELRDGNGDTALHIAVKKEQPEIVKELVLLMRPEDLAIKNDEGYTALHLAVNKGNVPIVKRFMTKEEGEADFDRYIPFIDYLINGDWDNAKECLRELDDPCGAITVVDPRDECGDTAFHVATRGGHVHILKELVSFLKVRQEKDLELKTAQDFTAFGSDITLGVSEEVVMEKAKYMVEQYEKLLTSILEVQHAKGSTPLHLAVLEGNVDMVKELVQLMRPEGLEIKDADGGSPLQIAVMNGNVDIVKELVPLMRKEGLEIKDADGDTTLHIAARNGNVDIVKELVSLTRKEGLEIEDGDGDTALNNAVLNGHVDIVKELVQSMRIEGLEVKNKEGSNALHKAVMFGCINIVKELMPLMRPEAMEEIDGEGYTALGRALVEGKDEDVMEMAKYMAENNSKVFGIDTPPLNWIPVVQAPNAGNSWDLCRYLYPLTPLEFLVEYWLPCLFIPCALCYSRRYA